MKKKMVSALIYTALFFFEGLIHVVGLEIVKYYQQNIFRLCFLKSLNNDDEKWKN